jgi:peroxiredoxin
MAADRKQGSTKPTSALPPGTPAPDFKLHTTPDQVVALSEFRGAPVILAFYPADWSPVCGDQMALYNEILPEFRRFNANLIGISVDGETEQAPFSAYV